VDPVTGASARRRYYVRLAAFVAVYVAIVVPVIWTFNRGLFPAPPVGYLVAALPALPVFGVIWAVLRYVVEEEDEFLRFLHLRGVVGATGLTLAVCTAWGFLGRFADVRQPSLMHVFTIFCALLLPALAWTHWRSR